MWGGGEGEKRIKALHRSPLLPFLFTQPLIPLKADIFSLGAWGDPTPRLSNLLCCVRKVQWSHQSYPESAAGLPPCGTTQTRTMSPAPLRGIQHRATSVARPHCCFELIGAIRYRTPAALIGMIRISINNGHWTMDNEQSNALTRHDRSIKKSTPPLPTLSSRRQHPHTHHKKNLLLFSFSFLVESRQY